MKIKKSDPRRRKSFRARHNCDNQTKNKSTLLIMQGLQVMRKTSKTKITEHHCKKNLKENLILKLRKEKQRQGLL